MPQHLPKNRRAGLNPFQSLKLPFLFILAVAIIGTSFVSYKAHRHSLEESLILQEEKRAHNNRDALQYYLSDRIEHLLHRSKSLAGSDIVRQMIQNVLAEPSQTSHIKTLRRLFNTYDYDFGLTNTTLLDNGGRRIFNLGHTYNFALSDPNIVTALQGHEFSDILQDNTAWILRAGVPYQIDNTSDTSNTTQGVLILTLNLNPILDNFARETQMRLVLADRNSIQARGGSAAASIVVDQKRVAQTLNKKSMQTVFDFPQKKLYHYMPIQIANHSLVLISEIDLGTTLQILEQKKQESLKLTLLLLAILLPLSAVCVHFLLLPLSVLQKKVAQVTKNLAGITLGKSRGHEINRLAHTFDAMASALEIHEEARQKAKALLQQERATLEVKVRERTKELEQANELLRSEVSERTRAQQKAEELQKLMAGLIDAIPSLLIGIDHNGRVNQWNLEAEKICGLSFIQVSGRQFCELLPQFESIKAQIDQTLSRGIRNKISHFPWTTATGDKLVDIVINPLPTEQYGGAVIRIDDVTEKIRLDEFIMQTEKMMSIGSLSAGMAHEINNPLASIIQGSQVITQRLSPELARNRDCAERLGFNLETMNSYLDERQIPKMMTSIFESGQRIGEIVSHMASFSQENKLGQAEQKVKELFDIKELLDLAVDMTTKDYDLKNKHNMLQIIINRNYPEQSLQMLGIPDQLKQVFFNLIQNAAQAMSAWKDMQNPPQIGLTLQKKKKMISVEICDNGPGIDIATQKRIFEPFFSTKEVGQGTGLGLSVSYFIITEKHRGQLRVTSTLGEGTCFQILLPLSTPLESGKIGTE